MKYLITVDQRSTSVDRFMQNIVASICLKIDPDMQKSVRSIYGSIPTFSQIRASSDKKDLLYDYLCEHIIILDESDGRFAERLRGNSIVFGKNTRTVGEPEQVFDTTVKQLYFYYSRQRQQKMREFLELELYKLYTVICKFHGYTFTNKAPEVRFCETIDDVKQVCGLIKKTKTNIFDFETRPIEDGLQTSEEIKSAAINFKKSLPTMLQMTHQAGIGWVVPMYHYESWFNVGMDDDIEVYYTAPAEHVWELVTIDHEWSEDYEYHVNKRGKTITNYKGDNVSITMRWAKLIKYHYDLCVTNKIGNYLRDVVFPMVGEVFDDPTIRKVGHNVIFDAKIVLQHILPWKETIFNLDDTMYLSHGINESRNKSLDDLTFRFLYQLVGYSVGIDYANADMYQLGTYGVYDIHVTAVADYMLTPILMEDALCYRVHRSLIIPMLSMLLKIEFKGSQLDLKKLEEATKQAEELRDKLEKDISNHPLILEYIQRRRAWEKTVAIGNLKSKLSVWRKDVLTNYMAKLREMHTKKYGQEDKTDMEILGHWVLVPQEMKGVKRFTTLANKIYMLQKRDYFNPDFPLKRGTDLQSLITDLEIGNSGKIYSTFNCNSNDELSEVIYREPYELDDLTVTDTRKVRKENSASFSTELDANGAIVDVNILNGGSGYKKDCVLLVIRDTNGRGAKLAVQVKAGVITQAAVVSKGSGYVSPKINIIAFSSPSEIHPYFYNQYNLDPRDKKPLGLGMDKLYCSRTRKITGTDETKKESGKFASTGRKILNRLDDKSGLLNMILEYRAVTKILNTYFKGFGKLMDDEGKLHTAYRLIRSMRLSSSNPNLQNIPSRAKEKSVAKLSKMTKKVFPAPSTDYIFFQKDLSQAELRWAAELWDINSMIDTYLKDGDIHVRTAAAVNDMTEDAFYKLEKATFKLKRYHAKSVNFGYLYAMLARKFKEMARDDYGIEITLEEAEMWRDRYFRLYPEIINAQLQQKILGHRDGFVRTAFGSKRHLPNIDMLNKYGYDVSDVKAAERLIKDNKIPWEIKNKVLSAERQAVNSPVQGTSGQGMVFSLIIFWMRKRLLDLDGEISNTVHDSGLGSVLKTHAEEFLIALGEACDRPPAEEYLGYWLRKVPMKSDDEFGPNWGTQYEIEAPLTEINFDAYNVPTPEYRLGMKAYYNGKISAIKGKHIVISSYSKETYFTIYEDSEYDVDLNDLTFVK